MIYLCSYCGRPIRPRDDRASSGDVDAISHGMCSRCMAVVMADLDQTVDQVRERSLGAIPACQRSAGL